MSECVPSPTNSEWGSTAWAQNVYIEPMQIDRWSETSRQWEIMDIRSMWITVGRCMRWRNADVRDNFAVNKGDSEVRISQILGNISDWTTNSKSSSGQSSQLGRTVADVIDGRKVDEVKECWCQGSVQSIPVQKWSVDLRQLRWEILRRKFRRMGESWLSSWNSDEVRIVVHERDWILVYTWDCEYTWQHLVCFWVAWRMPSLKMRCGSRNYIQMLTCPSPRRYT